MHESLYGYFLVPCCFHSPPEYLREGPFTKVWAQLTELARMLKAPVTGNAGEPRATYSWPEVIRRGSRREARKPEGISNFTLLLPSDLLQVHPSGQTQLEVGEQGSWSRVCRGQAWGAGGSGGRASTATSASTLGGGRRVRGAHPLFTS